MRILITGTSRGIGAGLKSELGARGHAVTGTHRDADSGDTWSLDVASARSIAKLEQRLDGAALDCLVCNAGVFLDKGMGFEELREETWANSLAVNVTGVALTVQACLPALRRADGARIAIISSKMGSDALAPGGSYAYRASKAAALNIGRNLAADLKDEGIAVQIFHPGWVQTDMGGRGADLTVDEATAALASRIEEIGIARTGAFLNYDGQELPF